MVRDGIFLVEIASALSSSTIISFLLQSEGCNTGWGASKAGHPTHGSSSLTSGRDRDGLIPSLQPNPRCLSAVLINTSQMWWNWPNIYCRKGDHEHSWNTMGWGHACVFVWALKCTVTLFFIIIYLLFLLGNNTQQGETAGGLSFSAQKPVKGLLPPTPSYPKAPAAPSPHPKSPRIPTPHPMVWSLSPVLFWFFVTVRASNSYCEILANQSTMEHGNNLEPELEITKWIPHRHKKIFWWRIFHTNQEVLCP